MEDNVMKYKLAGNLEVRITGKYLYILLCDLSGAKERIQIPVKKISGTLNISQGTVRRNLHLLEEKGYIKILPVFEPDGTRKANEYIIC